MLQYKISHKSILQFSNLHNIPRIKDEIGQLVKQQKLRVFEHNIIRTLCLKTSSL
jgi:hypothetical protein